MATHPLNLRADEIMMLVRDKAATVAAYMTDCLHGRAGVDCASVAAEIARMHDCILELREKIPAIVPAKEAPNGAEKRA